MNIGEMPVTVTEWGSVAPEEHSGAAGSAKWHSVIAGITRLRMVEYSAGFEADHWCDRGHIILVLEGELLVKFKRGGESLVKAGSSIALGDDSANPHKALSAGGAKVFVVD